MDSKMYKKINKSEGRAKLLSKLVHFTKGKLNKNQLEMIVNNKLTSHNNYIKVVTNAKEFAECITLKTRIFQHSWAGVVKDIEKGEVIFGNCSLGEDFKLEYSDNGNTHTDEERYNEPDFDIKDTICVFKHENSYSDFNNNYYDEDNYTIIVYLGGEDAYSIDPDIEYILRNFNINNE